METNTKLLNCYEYIKNRIHFKPEIGIVLGSGLGSLAEEIDVIDRIEYKDIEGFPISTVMGHAGRYVFGYLNQVPVVIMQGRVHYYEGYDMKDVVLPIRLMKLMGITTLFLTNAAGGVNYDFKAGDLMLITDQISSFVPSPLIGPNLDSLGERFSDMSEIYDKELQEIIKKTAESLSIDLKEGVYIQLSGPNFETPAEVRMCRILGADAVGMSTACEAIAANHMKLHICGISCISNLGCGMTEKPLSHLEVQETADRVSDQFKILMKESVTAIYDQKK
ncbi:purine nucleoside phosphorylase [Lachnospiraceae bacterium KM106-2]|nr:purine nucleoside phosphorylase [Lachnospiraceae bacterium KM106-2]